MSGAGEDTDRNPGGTPGYWVQPLIWGVFLSVTMFGLGFLAGSRWGEQQAAENPPAFATRLLPPAAEIRPPESERTPDEETEASGKVWGILTGQENPSPVVQPAPVPEGKSSPVSAPKPSSTPGTSAVQAPSVPPPPPPAAPREGTSRYSLQVISVQSREKAEALLRELNGKGYPLVRIVSGEVPGKGIWYRIRVGSFDRKEDAEALSRQFWEKERLRPQLMTDRN